MKLIMFICNVPIYFGVIDSYSILWFDFKNGFSYIAFKDSDLDFEGVFM